MEGPENLHFQPVPLGNAAAAGPGTHVKIPSDLGQLLPDEEAWKLEMAGQGRITPGGRSLPTCLGSRDTSEGLF